MDQWEGDEIAKWMHDYLRDEFGLGKVRVEFSQAPADDEDEDRQTLASVEIDEKYRKIKLRLCKNFKELPEERQAWTLVHETGHYVIARLEMIANNLCAAVEDEDEDGPLAKTVLEALETCVESFAIALYPHAPRLPWCCETGYSKDRCSKKRAYAPPAKRASRSLKKPGLGTPAPAVSSRRAKHADTGAERLKAGRKPQRKSAPKNTRSPNRKSKKRKDI